MTKTVDTTQPCPCTALRTAAHRATLHDDTALAEAGISVTMYRLLRRIEALDVTGAQVQEGEQR